MLCRETKQKDHEAASLTTPTSRKEEEWVHAWHVSSSSFFFCTSYSPGSLVQGTAPPGVKLSITMSVNTTKSIIHRHNYIPQMILHPLKLLIHTKHHIISSPIFPSHLQAIHDTFLQMLTHPMLRLLPKPNYTSPTLYFSKVRK